MTELLIDLSQMLDLPTEVSGQVRLGVAEIAKQLSEFFDGRYAFRLIWLDDGDFEGLLPYLEVMRK